MEAAIERKIQKRLRAKNKSMAEFETIEDEKVLETIHNLNHSVT